MIAPFMAKNVYSFGIIPIYRNKIGKLLFLLVRHLEGHTFRTGANGGHWAFPKGHPKDGEDSLSAAMREFKEETGIEEVEVIKDKKFEEHYSFSAHGTPVNKTVTYYLGIVGDSTVTIQEEKLQD